MQSHRNILCHTLIFTLLSGILTACGNAANTDITQTESAAAEPDETTAGVINWESSGLERVDYGGIDFTIFANKDSYDNTWHKLDVAELNGDSLNDAIFNRNRKIEELYNINISVIESSTFANDAKNSIAAGDNAYSLFFAQLTQLVPLSQEGMLTNFYDVNNLSLDNEWWDQNLIEGLTYRDSLYVLNGDVSPSADTRIFVILFNKDMCDELNLEYPYQYVLDGSWTVDRLNEYITNVNHDVNGDAVMDYDDRWGFFTEYGVSYMMFFAGGGKITEKTEDGGLRLAFNHEKGINMAQKAIDIALDASKTCMANPYVVENGNSWPAATAWFANGGALFRSTALEPVPRDIRTLEVNFGILPFPKMSDDQERYYSLPAVLCNVISIPVTADSDMAGLILEALCVESVGSVKPAFYDTLLNGKIVRDDDSKEMLDIIFDSKVYDIGLYANIMNFKVTFENMVKDKKSDVASLFASNYESAQAQLEKLCEQYDELLE
ncbi:MAG TPA: extracellular solute-binding protein [Firmicutes bacterium]|nr:extracellular solute-binding protein [Bacillota bacterium]